MLSQQEIKLINALKIKKYRTKYSQFIAEGDKIIKELIDKGMEVVHIYSTHPEEFNVKEIKKVSEADLKKVTALQHPNHSLAVFSIPTATFNIDDKEWIVVLDDIQDPGNMGTIIRTCDWFGVKKIICSEGCVDAYNPKVVQASMASIASVQIQEINLEEILMDSKLPIYGAVLNGSDYRQKSFKQKGFILIGNEGHGIRQSLQEKINYPITIPKKGSAESLNAAIATALILDKL